MPHETPVCWQDVSNRQHQRQVSGRNWSSQEAAHVNKGLKTVTCSHDFVEVSCMPKERCLQIDIDEKSDAISEALYLRRCNHTPEDDMK
eukprot:353722-Pleurochrysis_carterae.AAC.1